MSTNPTPNQQPQAPAPGLIASHVEYVKGAAEAAIGSAINSHAWTKSGAQDKASAISNMKAASEQRNASTQGHGAVEAKLGAAVGCEGMVKEGEASVEKK